MMDKIDNNSFRYFPMKTISSFFFLMFAGDKDNRRQYDTVFCRILKSPSPLFIHYHRTTCNYQVLFSDANSDHQTNTELRSSSLNSDPKTCNSISSSSSIPSISKLLIDPLSTTICFKITTITQFTVLMTYHQIQPNPSRYEAKVSCHDPLVLNLTRTNILFKPDNDRNPSINVIIDGNFWLINTSPE
ncbi:hypothetical protein HanIR_Chr10g0471361 [Helianthus annuus]|nr:hypothetical protein HanIR_Chr10g0471361 [Helianthus annuus]